MKYLHIDIETYSSIDLQSSGVYRYAEAPDFAVLLLAYSADGAPVEVAELAKGEELPAPIRTALTDPGVMKVAHNAMFERVCLSRWLGLPTGEYLDPAQWECTMAACARIGFPLALGDASDAFGLPDGKMKEGRALIRHFCKPNRKGLRNEPDTEKWPVFVEYCRRDVEVETEIHRRVGQTGQTAQERAVWLCDQRINDRGVAVDTELATMATRLDAENRRHLTEEAKNLTGLENPNSPTQLKEWLSKNTIFRVRQLTKADLAELTEKCSAFPKARRLLEIRKELGKTSVKKYEAMLAGACADGRIRGLLQYYGAARTGRWAGRQVQVQNLPQNHLDDLDYARTLVKRGDLDELAFDYPDVSQTLSELVRTALVARPGCRLAVCDFSAIEARVIAWLAGEAWVLDVFRTGGDIYCATAAQMFGVPVEKHGPNAELRAKGKVAVLALGYGGGVAALDAMGAGRMGLDETEERRIVTLWREANPRIVAMWRTVEAAAVAAISTGRSVEIHRGIRMGRERGMLTVTLPSGRALYYPRASVVETERGTQIEYEGTNQTTRKRERVRTYGGKLTENIVQAVARDILAAVLLECETCGLHPVLHVHDEVVCEVGADFDIKELTNIFGLSPRWAQGLPLSGEGYLTQYYKKD